MVKDSSFSLVEKKTLIPFTPPLPFRLILVSFYTMKFFKTIHTFNYEWSLVSAAQWQKYPNDHCPHVQHVDVLNRTVDPESGILTTERLITVKQNVPRLILKVTVDINKLFN